MKSFFKAISIVFTVLFLWAAYVQYNDPDALLWYAIYGSAAAASVMFFLEKLSFKVALLLFALYFIGVFIFWPNEFEGVGIDDGEIGNIEHARESFGLLINALVMLMYSLRIRALAKKA
ncbi:transmembrane 220 family protein [Sediminicola sp. 1XM1-17]|uniref:transmembrane 220 family protein n=1 Tax=Sediminicola sp. 1XM1-17 TaxID=3127702 RepID=UPI003076FE65